MLSYLLTGVIFFISQIWKLRLPGDNHTDQSPMNNKGWNQAKYDFSRLWRLRGWQMALLIARPSRMVNCLDCKDLRK